MREESDGHLVHTTIHCITLKRQIWKAKQVYFFPFFFFFSVKKVTNIFVLHVSGNYDVCGLRTTTIMMMHSQEQYIENVLKFSKIQFFLPVLLISFYIPTC